MGVTWRIRASNAAMSCSVRRTSSAIASARLDTGALLHSDSVREDLEDFGGGAFFGPSCGYNGSQPSQASGCDWQFSCLCPQYQLAELPCEILPRDGRCGGEGGFEFRWRGGEGSWLHLTKSIRAAWTALSRLASSVLIPTPAKGALRPLSHSPVQPGSSGRRARPAALSFARHPAVSPRHTSALSR